MITLHSISVMVDADDVMKEGIGEELSIREDAVVMVTPRENGHADVLLPTKTVRVWEDAKEVRMRIGGKLSSCASCGHAFGEAETFFVGTDGRLICRECWV